MNYWLMKSEPTVFSITDLEASPNKTAFWDGVRNYQVRNMLRDTFLIGDHAFFYHSSCPQPGIVGIVKIVRAGYPDPTQFDFNSEYYDPKSDPNAPRWYGVDVQLVQKFKHTILLTQLKNDPALGHMRLVQRGNRLSITPITSDEWQSIQELS